MKQRLGLLGRVSLAAVLAFEPLAAAAKREQPVAAHLQLLVERLHALVIEGIARLPRARAPEQRLMRVCEAAAAEVRHRIGLAPNDVVQDPVAEVLQDRAHAIDVVIAADDPERAVGFQQTPRPREPVVREAVVVGEARELVPGIVDAIDPRIVRAQEFAAKLQVIGRVGEDEIDRGVRQLRHLLGAVAHQHGVVANCQHVPLPKRKSALWSPRLGASIAQTSQCFMGIPWTRIQRGRDRAGMTICGGA